MTFAHPALKWFASVSGVLLVGGFGVFAWLESGCTQRGALAQNRIFVVREGDSVFDIAGRLTEEGFARHKLVMAYALLQTGQARSLLAASYRIPAQASPCDIARVLVSGETVPLDMTLTFPEGFTAQEMARRLDTSGFPGAAFLALVRNPPESIRERYSFLRDLPPEMSLEGYLFPDTYRFFLSASETDILTTLLTTFEKKALPVLEGTCRHNVSNREALIMASIVEGEVRTEQDRRMVADLFQRRLAVGVPLQSDATLRFALGEKKVKYSLEDTQVDSAFNTYAHTGLPPTPINNPGVVALRAVCNPLPNSYFFFLNDANTGETIFSETFEQHVRNKSQHGL